VTRTIRAIFAEIEDLDPDKFVAHFADNVVFRFGNGEPVVGRAALREAAASFFITIRGLTHHLVQSRDTAKTSIAKIDVKYVRADGKHVTAPSADILVFDSDLRRTGRSTPSGSAP
jgi:ketosteroid isomerase-like protein